MTGPGRRAWPGWADLSRLPQVGSRTLLAADAVVNGAASARRGPAAVSAATVPVAGAVADGGFVTTLLPADTQVIVVSVDPAGADRDLTGLTLGLDGAARATAADGTPVPPTVVTAGARMHLLYPVVPSAPGASAGASAGVEVTVGTDASWRLAGCSAAPLTWPRQRPGWPRRAPRRSRRRWCAPRSDRPGSSGAFLRR